LICFQASAVSEVVLKLLAVSSVSVIEKSTSTQTKRTTQSTIHKENITVMMQEQSTPKPCLILIYCVQDFLAKHSPSQADDSVSLICEELSSLKLPEYVKKNGLHLYCWKMSPVCYRMTAAGRLIPSSPCLLKWGIISNGVCITADISESHSNEEGYTLSDFLNQDVPEKYFLSPSAMQKILSKSSPDRKDSESTNQTE
jgi:hypothetical protein